MARTKPWEISDKLWELVEPLIPCSLRDPKKSTNDFQEVEENQNIQIDFTSLLLSIFCVLAQCGMHYQEKNLKVWEHLLYIVSSNNRQKQDSSIISGQKV